MLSFTGFLLAGGNTHVDSAMRWLIDQSGGGDFVVIRLGRFISTNWVLPRGKISGPGQIVICPGPVFV